MPSSEVYQKIRQLEHAIQNSAYEIAFWFDEEGNIVGWTPGDEGKILHTPEERQTMRGTIYTHHHPEHRLFLPSHHDLFSLVEDGITEFRTCSKSGCYVILSPEDPEDWIKVRTRQDLVDDYNFYVAEISEEYQLRYLNECLPKGEDSKELMEFSQKYWREIAEEATYRLFDCYEVEIRREEITISIIDGNTFVKLDYEKGGVYIDPETGKPVSIGAKEFYTDMYLAFEKSGNLSNLNEDNLRFCRRLGICE